MHHLPSHLHSLVKFWIRFEHACVRGVPLTARSPQSLKVVNQIHLVLALQRVKEVGCHLVCCNVQHRALSDEAGEGVEKAACMARVHG